MEKIYKATASGLEFHIDTTGWCKVYDPENVGVRADKGPAAELISESAQLYCMECGYVITDLDAGFFCSDNCRAEYHGCREESR
jgi:hypothetical protein